MVAVQVTPAPKPPRLRLTGRGRLVVVLFFVMVAATVAALAAPASRAGVPDRPGAVATVSVRPGDTLWSVAERHVPERETFVVVQEIRRLNSLDGYTIRPGQMLALPVAR